ncbi:Glycoside hydrolase family 16 protein [Mycena indigotica]|uniref:Glycoside hydrolase family 16 protein n=1 Tax=Mycena indigotica TaxID=2126181 RepID=A0A8H6TCL9_9AGAR|nr:Glycoside hydrolase family 16 protein [Mycena indigotica]KAF7316108.1 Glycoside hydrolase family 16 protein [Mycena indigotica]
MHSLAVLLPLISLTIPLVKAQGATCNVTTKCPETAPCCSEFGFCGTTEAFCLGGCNPLYSSKLDSCLPNPICKSSFHSFANNDRVQSNSSHWDGNATLYDFVVNNGNIMNTGANGGELAMLLTKENGGTRLSTTRYLHYGIVTARMKTGRWGGVVTAFITMSDVKDEIDWEFPGNSTTEGQSNYFWQGVVTQPNHGAVSQVNGDTFGDYHDYTIDWQPEQLRWLIDGKVVRTLKKSDVLTDGVSQYPTTPSRIQFSLWPAGVASSAAGTVQWAGGLINYDDPDYRSAGHFYALLKSVNITCADPVKPSADITGYKYGANSSTNTPSVALTNLTTNINAAAPGVVGRSVEGIRTMLAVLIVAGVFGQLI